MEPEGIYVSKQDVIRYELLQKVIEGTLSLRQITEALGVSYRQARRLKEKVAALGLRGLLWYAPRKGARVDMWNFG